MKTSLLTSLLFAASLAGHAALPVGSAFTYQGLLTEGGGPANGAYDLTFTLFDAAGGGATVGASNVVNDLGVTNGLFTIALDFGGASFDGAERWLEIAVRPGASAGDYTNLAPRQPITPTPYAIRALTFAGAISNAQLAGTYGSAVNITNPANVFAGSFNGNGGGLTNLNAASLVGPVPAAALSNAWKTGGNAGTIVSNNFLGTTDNQPFEIRVNNARVLRLQPDSTIQNAPNIIGGSPVNIIAPGIVGATIAGGGSADYEGNGTAPNTVGSSYGTVGGGLGNDTAEVGATVGGGYNNTSFGFFATVAGGGVNLAKGDYAFAGGGLFNQASNTASTVAGGRNNRASGTYSSIGGGSNVQTSGSFSTVAGGRDNTAIVSYGTVGGGLGNVSSSSYATVGGGNSNVSSGSSSTVAGGIGNMSSGDAATVGGGNGNDSTGTWATIGGGFRNLSSADYATIGGGAFNYATNSYATVGGGADNRATAIYATVAGGEQNLARGAHATVAGGRANQATTTAGTVGGGRLNRAEGGYSTVGGGSNGLALGDFSTVSGGQENSIYAVALWATVGGGRDNDIFGDSATVGGGRSSRADGTGSTIAGGQDNYTLGSFSTVGGGSNGTASGAFSTVGGGRDNEATNTYSTVVGGFDNVGTGFAATIGGGWRNLSSGSNSVVAGGYQNESTSEYSAVGGGIGNWATGQRSTVGGGTGNISSGYQATVPGGQANIATGDRSFAAGYQAHADDAGAFVWADNQGGVFGSTAQNQFLIRANGGVGIGHNNPDAPLHVVGGSDVNLTNGGVLILGSVSGGNIAMDGNEIMARNNGAASTLFLNAAGGNVSIGTLTSSSPLRVISATCDGNSWNNASDRNLKSGFKPVDATDVLAKVAGLPITSWHYTNAPGIQHIGPMAQDFHAAFGLGADDKSIATLDADGVALAAIQGMHALLREQAAELNALKRELSDLRRQVQPREAPVAGR